MATRRQGGGRGESDVLTRTETRTRLKRPRLYKVLLHNDDYTPREFVVMLLRAIFQRSESDATTLMLHAHNNGFAVVGVYPLSVAETKVGEVLAAAEKANYPLLCSLEPESDGDEDSDSGGCPS